ncbi:MAG: NADH-quinone oxidoreductase subunit L, partial [Verrucomicrobiota bacterium]|nr:NADH-quinone oxidoreductase subunit L [Verrucomicrobiota bacterium]
GLAGVVLTAFYMTRLVAEIFFGKPRSSFADHAHESPAVMTAPLVLLAICAIALGFIGTPAWPWLQSQLSGERISSHSLLEGGGLMALSIVLVALGLGVGWALYGRRLRAIATAPDPLATAMPGLFAFLGARMKFDELYAATVGRLNTFAAALADFFDLWIWGGAVNLLALLGELGGTCNRRADEAGLNAGFDAASEKLRGTGSAYSRAQTGEAHGYLRALAVAFVVLVLFVMLGGSR